MRIYYLLGMKQSAWVTRTGQYSTDISEAMPFIEPDAFKRIRTHKAAGNTLIPVRQTDMEAI